MTSEYNLRSAKKRSSEHSVCYLQKLLEKRSLDQLNPKVKLKRHKILENPESHNSIFYVRKDKVIARKRPCNNSFINANFLIFFCITFIALTLIYFKGEIRKQNFSLESIKNFQKEVKGYFLNLKKFLDKFPKKEIRKNAFQNRVLEMELKSDAGNEDKVSTEIQIKQIIKDHLNEILSKKEEKPQSFIKEENKKEDLSDESYNFTHESNELINNYFISALLTDYALELKGAKILSTFDTEPYGIFTMKFWKYEFETQNSFFRKFFHSGDPTSVLVPWTKPGDCWAFKGSHGRISIELSEKIVISAVTIDHIRSETVSESSIQSAPKNFFVVGIAESSDSVPDRIYLGSFVYKISGPSLQTFFVASEVETLYKAIEFFFESNHVHTLDYESPPSRKLIIKKISELLVAGK